jgi:hypothetical protein
MKKSQKNFQKNYKKKTFKNKCIVEDNEKIEPTNQEIINSDEDICEDLQKEELEENEESLSNDEIDAEELMKKEDFNLKLFMLVNKINLELWSM